MLFTYKAKSKDGSIVEGLMDSLDRFSLGRELRSRGNIPVSITEKKTNPFNVVAFLEHLLERVKTAELIILTKNLSGMIKAGLSLSRALSVLQKQTKNVTLRKVLISIDDDINSGGTLSSALAKFPNVFSKLFVSMTRAGEESGNLAGALSDIGLNLEKSYALTRKVRGALIYPGVIFSAMIVIGVLMFAFVVPTWAGNFFSTHLFLTFAIIILSALFLVALARAKFMARYIDFVIVRLPLIGTLAKELNTARTARTMSSLLLAGV